MSPSIDAVALEEKPGPPGAAPPNRRTRRAAFAVLAAGLAATLVGCRTVVRPPRGLFESDDNEDRVGGGGV